jgi:transposase InsO family protein
LSLNRSSYYRLKTNDKGTIRRKEQSRREKENEEYLGIIKEIKLNHPFFGYRRVRAYMKYKHKIDIGRKRVYRMMKLNDLLVEPKRYKAKRTPKKSKPKADKINQWWGTDMTKFYVNRVGWLYLVVVLDWFSKKVVGYDLSLRSKTQQWLDALNIAVDNNCPFGAREYKINLMSDNGSQPTSIKYEKEVLSLGINHVTTSYSNPKGNADTERFMRTFKEELIYINEFDSFGEAREAVDEFMKFYNEDYPHSALGEISPIEFENIWKLKNVA